MADRIPPSNEHITSLNPHDVLSGRGTGPNEYIGNQRFRNLIENRRKAYSATLHSTEKTRIAEEVYHQIQAKGGRFLSRVDRPQNFVIEDGVWKEISYEMAVEKCKQALRQTKRNDADRRRSRRNVVGFEESDLRLLSMNTHIPHVAAAPLSLGRGFHGPVLSPMLVGSGAVPPVPDPCLLLYHQRCPFRQRPMIPQAPPTVYHPGYHQAGYRMILDAYPSSYRMQQVPPPNYLNPSMNAIPVHNVASASEGATLSSQARLAHHLAVSDHVESSSSSMERNADPANSATDVPAAEAVVSPSLEPDSSEWALNDEISDFFLASLGWDSSYARFTEQQEAAERATMTEEEKAAVLADTLGKMCTITNHQSKRARRDLDETTVSFLLKQMRDEIVKIPQDKKQALLEAQQKCSRPDEFNNVRLEQFLRCEGMNPKVSVNSVKNVFISNQAKYLRWFIFH